MTREATRNVLLHSPNWLGDVVMALPAFRVWRDRNPDARVFVLARKSVAALWDFVRDVDGVIRVAKDRESERAARDAIRAAGCAEAILLPQSFRSAWIVWRAGVGSIRGTAGQFRSFMVSDTVSLDGLDDAHQSLEYARIFGVEEVDALPPPSSAVDLARLPFPACAEPASIGGRAAGVSLPDGASAREIGRDASTNRPRPDVSAALAVLPGAARGGSKRWPSAFFAETAAKALEAGLAARVLVCGTPGEAAECAAVADALAARFPGSTANLCGKTGLAELAGLLSRCRAVLSNDSGGMHLATAVGTPVVAVFGLTDPAKTGPLGRSRVVAAEGVKVSRSIPRESKAATHALASVLPDRVFTALRELIADA